MKTRLLTAVALTCLFSLILLIPATAAGGGFKGGGMGGARIEGQPGFMGGHHGDGDMGDRSSNHPVMGGGGGFHDRGGFIDRDRDFRDRDFRDRDHDRDFDDRDFRHHRDFDDFNSVFLFGFPFDPFYSFYPAYPYSPYSPYSQTTIIEKNQYGDTILLRDMTARWQNKYDLLVSWSGESVRVDQVAFSLLDRDKNLIEVNVVRTPPYTLTFRDVPNDAAYLQLAIEHNDGSIDSAMKALPR